VSRKESYNVAPKGLRYYSKTLFFLSSLRPNFKSHHTLTTYYNKTTLDFQLFHLYLYSIFIFIPSLSLLKNPLFNYQGIGDGKNSNGEAKRVPLEKRVAFFFRTRRVESPKGEVFFATCLIAISYGARSGVVVP
jgi:hypothetical protein